MLAAVTGSGDLPTVRSMYRLRTKIAARTRRELRFRLGALVGHRAYDLFALVGHARTGSNYVLRGLATSSAVRVFNEPFADHNRRSDRSFDDVLSDLRGRQPRSVHVVGFKLFYYHLSDAEWSKLVELPSLRVVHLTRRNRLRTLVSLAIATKTDRWTGTRGRLPITERRIALDVPTLVQRLDEVESAEETARRRLYGLSVCELVYEDIVANPLAEFGRVGRFLGIEGMDVKKITLPRQNSERLDELVVNFDEVAARVARSRHASCLAD